ncbi:related to Virulence STM3117 [Lecanosticta acicola]|uniref:Related to Virulence STM3117 n=1 Tax=Lecanosticta acicola TaxID=111012 RepID=A0AAI8YZI9_9PEZI|nr:related to Virulence STM3117 [Lecanosticta acicola]
MASFAVRSIDHVVLTVKSLPKTIDFYTRNLGMKHEVFTSKGQERHALLFGTQKLNLHQSGREFEPKATNVQPGSEDLCFIIDEDVEVVRGAWKKAGGDMVMEEGGEVVERTGAVGRLRSVYCRDPDGNLIE